MASGIFALLDDISILADDVTVASKVATAKTTAILGDDLAVSAQKAMDFDQSRELQIIWAITKGSLKNKAIILPIAFLLNAIAPNFIIYILIAGGIYLIYEGIEKIDEYIFHKQTQKSKEELLKSTKDNILKIEEKKIKSAIFTDFILSIEIIIMALSSVANQTLLVQSISTIFVAILATFMVYGVVAIIVRMDNLGFWLIEKKYKKSGLLFINAMPKLIKILSVVGTFAMILVGGSILMHHIDLFHLIYINFIPSIINELFVGLISGVLILTITKIFKKTYWRLQ